MRACLVIGGSDENPYGDGFFEVGGHSRAHYGSGMNWMEPSFWYGLWQTMGDRRFVCGMFDRGSESWFHGMTQECMEAFVFTMVQLCPFILIEGQIVADGFEGIRPMASIRRILEEQQKYAPIAFFRVERNAVIYIYGGKESHLPIAETDGGDQIQILPIEHFPHSHIPSVTVMPYRELTPLKNIVSLKFNVGFSG